MLFYSIISSGSSTSDYSYHFKEEKQHSITANQTSLYFLKYFRVFYEMGVPTVMRSTPCVCLA